MKPVKDFKAITLTAISVAILIQVAACTSEFPKIEDKEVILQNSKMEIRFARGESFQDAYIMNGANESSNSNTVSNIFISGISMADAAPIFARYSDFYMCKSPGASMAKAASISLSIIPADRKALKSLQRTISVFKDSLKPNAERVGVKLTGEILEMTAARLRHTDKDIFKEMPASVREETYYLVEAAEIIEDPLSKLKDGIVIF